MGNEKTAFSEEKNMTRQMLRIRVIIVAILIAVASVIAFSPPTAHAGDAPGGGHTPIIAPTPTPTN